MTPIDHLAQLVLALNAAQEHCPPHTREIIAMTAKPAIKALREKLEKES